MNEPISDFHYLKRKHTAPVKRVRSISSRHIYRLARGVLGKASIRKLAFFQGDDVRPYLHCTTWQVITSQQEKLLSVEKKRGVNLWCRSQERLTRDQVKEILK